jgi:hypothetical protein
VFAGSPNALYESDITVHFSENAWCFSIRILRVKAHSDTASEKDRPIQAFKAVHKTPFPGFQSKHGRASICHYGAKSLPCTWAGDLVDGIPSFLPSFFLFSSGR